MRENRGHHLFILTTVLIVLLLGTSACSRVVETPSDIHDADNLSIDLAQPASGYGFRVYCTTSLGASIKVFGTNPDALPSAEDGILMGMDSDFDYELTVEWYRIEPVAGIGESALDPAAALEQRLSDMVAQGTRVSLNNEPVYGNFAGDQIIYERFVLDNGQVQNASAAAWYCADSERMFIVWLTSYTQHLDLLDDILIQYLSHFDCDWNKTD